ncbi:hypothetical protein BDF19DRAFT_441391 [Syncephalis fuscata]|nr:hypothetical protein BDF19DRAFT_441391 [Syncephalis fuscata]
MVQFRILLPYLTCFTLVLFQVLPSYANGGNHNGIVREDGFAIKEINKSRNLQASGLVIERWIYGKIRLSLAKIQWKNQEAILKCMHDSMFNKHERVVFEVLVYLSINQTIIIIRRSLILNG